MAEINHVIPDGSATSFCHFNNISTFCPPYITMKLAIFAILAS